MRANSDLDGALRARGAVYLDSVDSTNAVAKRMARAGAPHGTLVIAGEQTQGRGRRGRSWVSPPGAGVWMTLLVRPQALSAARASELVFVSAVALCQACRDLSGLDVGIKWPNDLVAQGKKISGTLLEMQSDEKFTQWAVIGSGVNVTGVAFPPDLPHAGSLEGLSGREIDRDALCLDYLDRFEAVYARWAKLGLAGIMQDYRALSVTLGARVRARCANGVEYEGVALKMDGAGELVIQTGDGQFVTLSAGDVSVRGIMGYV